MEKQIGGQPQSSFLVTYESGKLIAVDTIHHNSWGQLQDNWVWEITGDELTLTFKAYERGEDVFHFKRV
jgi:hypothetical protein